MRDVTYHILYDALRATTTSVYPSCGQGRNITWNPTCEKHQARIAPDQWYPAFSLQVPISSFILTRSRMKNRCPRDILFEDTSAFSWDDLHRSLLFWIIIRNYNSENAAKNAAKKFLQMMRKKYTYSPDELRWLPT